MFGNPQTSGGFGASNSGGGLFGQASQGLGGGGGLFGQPQNTSGGFGQTSSGGFGALGALGTQPQNQPSTPVFGSNQPAPFGGNTSGGLFGVNQNNTSGSFGASNSSGFGAFGQQAANASGGFGTFGQNAQKPGGFGNQGGFGATASTGFGGGGSQGLFGQPQGGGGLLGQTSSSGFGGPGLSTFGQQNQIQQTLTGVQQQAAPTERGFYRQSQPMQTINTWGQQYQGKTETTHDSKTGAQLNAVFNSIKAEPNFQLLSTQMIKMMDTILFKSNGANNQPSYEFLAAQEFQAQGQQQYKFYQQVTTQTGGGMVGQGNPQGGGMFGAQKSGAFGGMNNMGGGLGGNPQGAGGFGQANASGGLFGGQASTGFGTQGAGFGNTSGGLFGGNKPATGGFGQPAAGGGGLFGQAQQPQNQGSFGANAGGFGAAAQGGGLFGQPQNQPQNQPFGAQGGGGLFGQQPQAQPTGGLFGNQPQQQPAQGLFGQQQPAAQGGLFGAKPAGQGGLFGGTQPQQQQPTGGGLFGQPAAGAGGGLFGQQQQAQPQGGMFGGAAQGQPQPGGSLFGGNQNPPGAGGLFGVNTAQPAGGGLFGQQNAQQQPSGSLFGGAGAQPAAQGGGLFGAKPAGSGLFGAGGAQPGAGGGLFGGAAQANQPAAGGGLFGAQAQPAAGGGLFGAQAQPSAGGSLFGAQAQPTGGGLFGGAAAGASGQTGLFGAKPAAQGGLFGAQVAAGGGGGGLFGAQGAAGAGGGLFGQPAAGGGLFGAAQPAGQTPSLFGGAGQQWTQQTAQGGFPQQPQQSLQALNPYANLELRQDPFAIQGSYLDKESPFANIDVELKKFKEQQLNDKAIKEAFKDVQILSEATPVGALYSFDTPSSSTFNPDEYQRILAQKIEEDEFEKERQKKSQDLIKKYEDLYSSQASTATKDSHHGSESKYFNPVTGYSNIPRTAPIFGQPNYKPNFSAPPRPFGMQDRSSYIGSSIYERATYEYDQSDEDLTMPKANAVKGVINIQVVVPSISDDPSVEDTKLLVQIHKSRMVSDLHLKVKKHIADQLKQTGSDDFVLLYKNRIIKEECELETEGITESCKVYVVFSKPRPDSTTSAAPPSTQSSQIQNFDSKLDQLAPASKLPTNPKEGYKTSPPYLELVRMTLRELMAVEDFTIYNEHGKIQFEGATDLSEVDLEKIVTIEKGSAEVYDDTDPTTVKPPVGHKLNKPAIISLYDMDLKNAATHQAKVLRYKELMKQRDSEYISYTEEKKLTFKVFHFTKYNFDAEEGESSQASPIPPSQPNYQQQREQDYAQMDEALLDNSVQSQDEDIGDSGRRGYFRGSFTQLNETSGILPRTQTQVQQSSTQFGSSYIQRQMSKPNISQMLTTTQDRNNAMFSGKPFAKEEQQPSFQHPIEARQRQTVTTNAFTGAPQSTLRGQSFQTQGIIPQYSSFNQATAGGPAMNRQDDQHSIISDVQSLGRPEDLMTIDQLGDRNVKRKQERIANVPAGRQDRLDEISLASIRTNRMAGSFAGDKDSQMLEDDRISFKSQATGGVPLLLDQAIESQKRLQASKILASISQKKDNLQKLRDNKKIEREKASKAMQIFASKGVVKAHEDNNKIRQPLKMLPMRPVFAPNGSLLTVKQNSSKIIISNINLNPQIKLEDEKKAYAGLTDILQTHGSFTEDEVEPNLGLEFRRLNLQQNGLIQKTHENPQSFEDPYFEKLLAVCKVHTLEFATDPVDQFYLFESLAKMLVKQIQECERFANDASKKLLRQKLQEEFYVVCMLNAIFGNPCIHLVQLHHNFRGVSNYNKARAVFGRINQMQDEQITVQREFRDEHTFVIQKQRRNALSEVIRFICTQEYPVPAQLKNQGAGNVYQVAQYHLINGDLKGALAHLTEKGKHKMALIVSQAFTSGCSSKFIENMLINQSAFYQKFSQDTLSFLEFLQGKLPIQPQSNAYNWLQWLQYYLNVKCSPADELIQILESYHTEVYSQLFSPPPPQQQQMLNQQAQRNPSHQTFSLIYFLVRIYAAKPVEREVLIQKHLTSFEGLKPRLTVNNVQDHRLQLLTVTSLYYLQSHYRVWNEERYAGRMRGFNIDSGVLAHHASNYAHHLLRAGDWKQALLAIQIIPQESIKIKKQFIFQVLQHKALHLTYNDALRKPTSQVINTLKISPSLVNTARGFAFQYQHHYEQAFGEWLGNDTDESRYLTMAHFVLEKRILPLYFKIEYDEGRGLTPRERLDKQLFGCNLEYLSSKLGVIQDSYETLQRAFEVASARNNLEAQLKDKFERSVIYNYVFRFLYQLSQSSMMINSQGDLQGSTFSQPNLNLLTDQNRDVITRAFIQIAKGLGFKSALQQNQVERFIWEHLVRIDCQEKIKNAKEISEINSTVGGARRALTQDQMRRVQPMLELVNLYPENPQLIKLLDQISVHSIPLLV